MNEAKPFGAIVSAPDYRDHIAAASVVAELDAFDILPTSMETKLGPVMDQNKIPACVSHSVVELLKLYWFKKTGKWIDFSPRFLDILSAEDWIPLDGGRVPRTVLKIAANMGCCTTALLPNDTEGLSIAQYRDKSVITQAMKDEAYQYRIPGFIYIDVSKMRKGVWFYDALTVLFSVGKEMYIPSWLPKDTVPLRIPAQVESGHQMTVKGWKDAEFNYLRNSWSGFWGNNGETIYDESDWRPFVHEAWAVADIPEETAEFLKNLPSQNQFKYQWNTNLSIGQFNNDVKFAQIALMILGFLKAVKPEDLGHYGPKTAAAVLAFQSWKKIAPTAPNSIGPKTRAELNKLFAI